ncbi:MAG TPA: M1 family aminopeptidase [Flavobacteriales bacterium]|nr:M1 family aminopeptidase [Flavobacteriales bacterium]HPH82751.1 M1 family aminopeptidase [Flavobacteriales bacterium]
MFRFILTSLLVSSCLLNAQPDLSYIHLQITPNFEKQDIQGNIDQIWNLNPSDTLIELNLYPEFIIQKVTLNKVPVTYSRFENLLSIPIKKGGSKAQISIQYAGKPRQAIKPPWDGGFIWKKDINNKNWLTVACQDEGAQLWWPAPTKYSDEPDSALITATYPKDLFFKSNGKLAKDRKNKNHTRTTSWKVTYPINTYNITLNFADYIRISDTLLQANGKILQLNYYPLSYNKDKAIKQFTQVKPMLRYFESYFGSYPFYRDGYSVVETPYPGMEHQSCIAYGNGYTDGYNGKDYSNIDLWFDFILIHETGHEWWGNSTSAASKRDFWLQEAFCTYAEYVYVYERFGKLKAEAYMEAKKRLVSNKAPILSNDETGIDMYSKGALMLHTLQQFASSDEEWFKVLKEFALAFRSKSISTEELENWFSQKLPGVEPIFFEQYLRLANPPQLEITQENGVLSFRIRNALQNFVLPLYWIAEDGKRMRIDASANLQTLSTKGESIKPDSTSSYFELITK